MYILVGNYRQKAREKREEREMRYCKKKGEKKVLIIVYDDP